MTRSRLPIVAIVIALGMVATAPFTEELSPVVTAADSNSYFDALITRAGFWKGYSFRPRPGEPVSSPYFANQLEYKKDGGYQGSSSAPRYVTYDPQMDAAKVIIPAWMQPGWTTVVGANISPSDSKIYASPWTTSFVMNRQVKIDNEIMLITGADPDATIPRGLMVSRGQYGTTAASHAAGVPLYLGNNSLPHQVRVPLDTVDGNTYVFTWDVLFTSSFVGTGLAGNKTFQFSSGKDTIWWEVKTRMEGGSVGVSYPPDFDKTKHVGALDVRSYNRPGGDANWLLTDGTYLGPPILKNQPVQPMLTTFTLHPNRWIRYWVRVEQRLNDYDYIDMWVADEVQAPIQMYRRIPASTFPDLPHSINKFWIEFNDSQARLPEGRTKTFADLVAYVRNFAALRNIGDIAPLLQRPVPGALPGPTVAVPAPPQNVRIVAN